MTIPFYATENVLNAEPRRGSIFSIPTLRRALARRMWGLELGSNKNVEDVQQLQQCSPKKQSYVLLNLFDLASAELQSRLRVMPSVRQVERSSTRGSEDASLFFCGKNGDSHITKKSLPWR